MIFKWEKGKNMRILKTNPVLTILNSYLVDSPQPSTLSYLWNFGSLLGLCLVAQIVTGVLVSMHYQGSASDAFTSVEHVMRDVNDGWLLRMCHANMASFFFIAVYLHIARGLYFGSYRTPRVGVWVIGTIIFFLMMATAFLGKYHCPKWSNIYIRSKSINNINVFSNNFQKRNYSTNNTNINCSITLFNFIREKGLKPVFVYEDLDLEEKRKIILKDTRGLSGIYLILNKITLDYYIGSASTGRIYTRFSNHLIHKKGSKIVKLAVNKYNLSNFAFMVLELFPDIINRVNNKDLLNIEDFYLKSLLPNYNILTEAGNSFGYKHTEITRIKMKVHYSEKRRKWIGDLNRGKSFSKETIMRMKQSSLNRKKPVYSEEALLNMKKKSKKLIVLNLNGTVYGKYPSITEAIKILKCNAKTVSRTLKTEEKILKKRWIIKLDEE
jgi:group I intron endonuclease